MLDMACQRYTEPVSLSVSTCEFEQDAVSQFVAHLKETGVFAKEVRSAGVAFHSYYMAAIAPALLSALKRVRATSTSELHFIAPPTGPALHNSRPVWAPQSHHLSADVISI